MSAVFKQKAGLSPGQYRKQVIRRMKEEADGS
jgi:hypothetical protein